MLRTKTQLRTQKSEDQTNVQFLGKARPSVNPHQEARSYPDQGIEIKLIEKTQYHQNGPTSDLII